GARGTPSRRVEATNGRPPARVRRPGRPLAADPAERLVRHPELSARPARDVAARAPTYGPRLAGNRHAPRGGGLDGRRMVRLRVAAGHPLAIGLAPLGCPVDRPRSGVPRPPR